MCNVKVFLAQLKAPSGNEWKLQNHFSHISYECKVHTTVNARIYFPHQLSRKLKYRSKFKVSLETMKIFCRLENCRKSFRMLRSRRRSVKIIIKDMQAENSSQLIMKNSSIRIFCRINFVRKQFESAVFNNFGVFTCYVTSEARFQTNVRIICGKRGNFGEFFFVY